MANDVLKITRNQLAKFCPDSETIKQFERLFRIAAQNQSTNVQDSLVVAGNADAKAEQAIGLVFAKEFWKRVGAVLIPKNTSDKVNIQNTEASTGTGTGALQVDGGAYIEKETVITAKLEPDFLYIPNVGATIGANGTYLYNSGDHTILNQQGGNSLRLQKSGNDIFQVDSTYIRGMQEATFNYNFTDDDFIINKNVSGQAYKYDAGLDTHNFSGDAFFDGKIDFISSGLIDFGNWKFSESGVTLFLKLGGNTRALIQNGIHAAYGWELSWYNPTNSNRFGFISPSEGNVELRGTKNITTSPISFSVYNTYTNSSNYERGLFDWKKKSNVLTIGTEAAGTGTVRDIEIVGGNVTAEGSISAKLPTQTQSSTVTLTRENSKVHFLNTPSQTITAWGSAEDGDSFELVATFTSGSCTIAASGSDTIEENIIYSGERIKFVYDSATTTWYGGL